MNEEFNTGARKKIDSVLSALGIEEKSEISEKLLNSSWMEYMSIIGKLVGENPSISDADVNIPSNAKELQTVVMKFTSLLEDNGVDLSLEYEKVLNGVLQDFLSGMEESADPQAITNARALIVTN